MHWLVWSEDLGWVRFPAEINGWERRRPATNVARDILQPVPLGMAFNTGLIEWCYNPTARTINLIGAGPT